MSKNDTASGLLSKLVKFVRNPSTSWADLDALGTIDSNQDDLVSKQLLGEMIERKRRNDFVRKREFDMLRKLRKLEALVQAAPGPGGQPSFSQSGLTSHREDRASTLKKIDEIEAQMSTQWWKTNNPSVPRPQAESAASAKLLPESGLHGPSGLPDPSPGGLLPAGCEATRLQESQDANRSPASASDPMPADLLEAFVRAPMSRAGQARPADAKSSLAFNFEGLEGLRPIPNLTRESAMHDIELEEAAILFANGDDAAAEAGLLESLAPGASHADHAYIWLTLLDLYRATGNPVKFEAAAVEFAQRFSRSAPQWFSMPDRAKSTVQPASKVSQERAVAHWICPSLLGLQSVNVLSTVLARAAMPWCLDWSHLKTIEAGALAPLHKVFTQWASQPVQLRFIGDGELQQVLLDATPSGNAAIDPEWWQLRMELLRVIHRPDDFELAALDFCVIYEVSPPAWTAACCTYQSLDDQGDAMGRATIIGEPVSEMLYSTLLAMEGDSTLDFSPSHAVHVSSVELSGQIQGDAMCVMETLEASLAGTDRIQISCAKLIRVDFSAAGMLLNWVSARQAENRSVEFCEVNRLVAAFFNVIGIVEHAKVTIRCD